MSCVITGSLPSSEICLIGLFILTGWRGSETGVKGGRLRTGPPRSSGRGTALPVLFRTWLIFILSPWCRLAITSNEWLDCRNAIDASSFALKRKAARWWQLSFVRRSKTYFPWNVSLRRAHHYVISRIRAIQETFSLPFLMSFMFAWGF